MRLRLQPEAKTGNPDNLLRLQPAVRPPDESVLASLSNGERDRLRQLLSKPYEYVQHPSFGRLPELPDRPAARRRPAAVTVRVTACPATGSAQAEVLTAEQECRLFYRFNYRRYRVFGLLQRHRGRRLGDRATRALLRWDRLAGETRAALVHANISLVLAMAWRTHDGSADLGELISDGNLALLRCVDKFDCSRGYKFSTYACRAILSSFSQAREQRARYCVHYRDAHDSPIRLTDCLEREPDCAERDEVGQLRQILLENTAGLSVVERRILDARYSLSGGAGFESTRARTLDEVGTMLGVSRECVRQVQKQAIVKLRTALERRLPAAS